MIKKFFKLQEEAGAADSLLGGGSGQPPADKTPPPEGGQPPVENPLKDLYGDLHDKIEWPEGFPDDLKVSPAVKPFVGQDGKINLTNLAKSYIHTKKLVGNKDAVTIPNENSTDEERAEFYKKLGYEPDLEQYKIELPENSKVTPEFAESIKAFMHKNYVPPKVANELVKFLEGETENTAKAQAEAQAAAIKSNIDSLKQEFGSAFDETITLTKRFIKEAAGDDASLIEAFSDPQIGSNPVIVKLLAKAAKEAYSEDSSFVPGSRTVSGRLSPADAINEINTIRGDKSHPFNNSNHPGYADAQKKMLELYRMKNGQ